MKKSLSDYITMEYIQKSIELISKQSSKKKRSIDFQVYKKSGQLDFYKKNITYFYNNIFKENKFYNHPDLLINNSFLRTRKRHHYRPHNFISLELRIIFYAINLYLMDITKENRSQMKYDESKIIINLGNSISENKTDYKIMNDTWVEFRKNLVSFIECFTDYPVVIELDVNSFFYNIKHSVVVDNLKKIIKPDVLKNKLGDGFFDELLFFLKYLMGAETGVPVADECFPSSFIANLVLEELDSEIVSFLTKKCPNFKMIRFVDEYNFIIPVEDEISYLAEPKSFVKLESMVNDHLFKTTGMSLNKHKFKLIKLTPENKAKVVGEREVEYEGENYKLSALVYKLYERLGKLNSSGAYQGANYFLYKGKKLRNLKDKK